MIIPRSANCPEKDVTTEPLVEEAGEKEMGCPAACLQPWLPPPSCLPFSVYGAFLGIFFLADSQHSSAGDTQVAPSLPPRT